jgi:predicted signal transduction protein with EAL and GGDEF domain
MMRWLREAAFTVAMVIGGAFIALALAIGEPEEDHA